MFRVYVQGKCPDPTPPPANQNVSIAATSDCLSRIYDFLKLSGFCFSFLPRGAMHKRGLGRHAVSVCVCLSVCLSVTFVDHV